jgi:8-oxo-dGTP diphosphatase
MASGKSATRTQDRHHGLDRRMAVVGVGAMVLRGNRVLLGRRKGSHGAGQYAWCGGGVEFNETLEDAVAREVRQESGMRVTRTRLLCVSNIREYGRHYVDFEFLVDAEGDPVVREPWRCESWEWYDLDKLPQPLFRPVERGIDSYRATVGRRWRRLSRLWTPTDWFIYHP